MFLHCLCLSPLKPSDPPVCAAGLSLFLQRTEFVIWELQTKKTFRRSRLNIYIQSVVYATERKHSPLFLGWPWLLLEKISQKDRLPLRQNLP